MYVGVLCPAVLRTSHMDGGIARMQRPLRQRHSPGAQLRVSAHSQRCLVQRPRLLSLRRAASVQRTDALTHQVQEAAQGPQQGPLPELDAARERLHQLRGTRKLSKEDFDVLPHRIVLLRHAESLGNVNSNAYCTIPDHAVPLTPRGRAQAQEVGRALRDSLHARHGDALKVFVMTSPYRRTLETTDELLGAFTDSQVAGVRQAVQLRELEMGNLQHPDRIATSMTERQKFSRVWFRFPEGESCADVFDRITIFEDHLSRDMLLGRYQDCTLVLVTHGLTMRIWLWRWFHWTVDEFLQVYNPPNSAPIVLEKLSWEEVEELRHRNYVHAKHAYAITPASMSKLRGCLPSMTSYFSRTGRVSPKQAWFAQRQAMAERGLYTSMDCGVDPLPCVQPSGTPDGGQSPAASFDECGLPPPPPLQRENADQVRRLFSQ